ncbi:MAG TPA: hypothetical protein VFK38_06845 [Candidatus Limnocylindrales bacterium]|nr:hypothetical protein [Candidatus Limnocylindrales bacterium]
MPQLRGAPAYARPPRPVQETPRPVDPDDLPIEAQRTDEERLLAEAIERGEAVAHSPADSAQEPHLLRPSDVGGLKAIAAKLLRLG